MSTPRLYRVPVETATCRYNRRALTPCMASLVYLCRTADGSLLYVGITANPVERWRRHAQKKAWWPEVSYIEFEAPQPELWALERERELIRSLRPQHNIRSATA